MNKNRERALEESKRFLHSYYSVDYRRESAEKWVAMGSPQERIEHIREFVEAGATTITLRPTAYDHEHQFKLVSEEVLPAFA